MSTASIPAIPQAPSQAGGLNKTEAKGIEGLFELISQGLNFDAQVAAGQPAHSKAAESQSGRCIEQCLAEPASDSGLENLALGTLSTNPGENLLNSLKNNPLEPAVQAESMPDDHAPTLSQTAETHLTDLQFATAAQASADLIPASIGASPPPTPQGNTPDPLARAIQVLNTLAGAEAPSPLDKPSQAVLPQNVTALPNPIPGLDQARQQLESNVLRFAGDNGADARLDAAGTANNSLAQNAASASSAVLGTQQGTATHATNPTQSFNLPGNIHQPAWQQALAERVVMLTHQNIHQAELKLHPAELGSVSVRLESLHDGPQSQTQLQFAALNADTREALEAALPKLRELFNQQGMNLVRADIQHSFSQSDGNPNAEAQPHEEASENAAVSDARTTDIDGQRSITRSATNGLLDLYV